MIFAARERPQYVVPANFFSKCLYRKDCTCKPITFCICAKFRSIAVAVQFIEFVDFVR